MTTRQASSARRALDRADQAASDEWSWFQTGLIHRPVIDARVDVASGRWTRRRGVHGASSRRKAGTYRLPLVGNRGGGLPELESSRHGLRATTSRDTAGAEAGDCRARRVPRSDWRSARRCLVTSCSPDRARSNGKPRGAWGPRSINLMLFVLGRYWGCDVAGSARPQRGWSGRPVPNRRKAMDTFTEEEVRQLLKSIRDDDLEHVWHLALYGLRRGELAGLRGTTSTIGCERLTIREPGYRRWVRARVPTEDAGQRPDAADQPGPGERCSIAPGSESGGTPSARATPTTPSGYSRSTASALPSSGDPVLAVGRGARERPAFAGSGCTTRGIPAGPCCTFRECLSQLSRPGSGTRMRRSR